MDEVNSLLGRHGFLPHGYCFTWQPGLLWTLVGSDAVIAGAYFSIPLAMARFVRQRRDASFRWLAGLFAAFIFACGLTHVADIWTVWQPDYAWQALAKAVTAVLSLVTAVALWRLVPQALKIPSVGQLQTVIQSLEQEVARRRTAEDHLAEVEQSLAATLASIGAGFMATDAAGRVTRMNSVAERVLGWTQAEALGHGAFEVFDRESRPADFTGKNPVQVMVEQGYTVETARHLVAISRSGVRTPVEVKAALTYAQDGSVRGMAVIFRDTSREQRTEAALRDSEGQLRFTLEAAQIGDWELDLASGQARVSLQHARCFGYASVPPLWTFDIFMAHVHPDDRTAVVEQFGQGVAQLESFALECRVVWPDTRTHWVRLHAYIRRTQGVATHALGISIDITQQKLAEQARLTALRLEAENRQIQEASRMKSQFLANMSHELRTPLNAVIGFADLLQSGAVPAASPKHREYLGHIGNSGRHLLQLINDVLDLSKVEAGKFEFFPEPVRLTSLVREVGDVLHTALLRKHIVLSIDIDPVLDGPAGVPGLRLDPARLKQALYNYLSNAIKFTPERGQVQVRARPAGPLHWRLEVQDNGIGIAANDLPRLFTDFQQLDAGLSKQHQGTGLGLALTRRLVQAQGGSVGVRSTPGVGSVFHLVLPRVAGSTADGPAGPQQRLLLIEDDTAHAARLAGALAGAGFQVDAAADGAHALQQALAHVYQAITLDLVLPDQSGLALLSDIRQRGLGPLPPVVGVSLPAPRSEDAEPVGGAAAGSVGRGTGTGTATFAVADVLFKPIRTQEVAAAMARLRSQGGLVAKPARVLVIDDDPLALALMQATLAGLGLEAVCVEGGQQALDWMDRPSQGGPPDRLATPPPAMAPDGTGAEAVVLDLMMPGLDGFQVLHALRQRPAWRLTPVFIWTSLTLTDAEIARLSLSAQAILHKGGGTLDPLLDHLRQWQAAPPLPAPLAAPVPAPFSPPLP